MYYYGKLINGDWFRTKSSPKVALSSTGNTFSGQVKKYIDNWDDPEDVIIPIRNVLYLKKTES